MSIMDQPGAPLDDRSLDEMAGRIVRLLVFPAQNGPLRGKTVEVAVPQVRFRQMVAQLTPSHAKLLAGLAATPTRQSIERSAIIGGAAAEASATALVAYRKYADNPGAALALHHFGAMLCLTEMPSVPPGPHATITVRVPTDEIEAAITRLRAEADRVNALAGETSGGVEFAIVVQELQRVRAERDALRARSLGPKGEEALSALWRLAHAAATADTSGLTEDRRYADRLWGQMYGHALVLGLSEERNGDQRADLAPQARRAAETLLLAGELAHARAGHRETWLPAAARDADQWRATFLSRLDVLYDEAEAAMDEAERAANAAERKARAAITGRGAVAAPSGKP